MKYVKFQHKCLILLAVLVADTAVANEPAVTQVSVNNLSWPESGGGRDSNISANGRYVTFSSASRTLVPFDSNDAADIFVRDQKEGITRRVSVSSTGAQSNGNSYGVSSLSADGRYVVFSSDGDNLVAGDTNSATDIFLHDLKTDTTERISVGSDGAEANSDSYGPYISYDGRYVVFTSSAENLVANDQNNKNDVFIRDRKTGTTSIVSVSTNGVQGNEAGFAVGISGNGKFVVFESDASTIVDSDTNQGQDIFLHEVLSGNTSRISVSTDGTEARSGNRFTYSWFGDITSDGRYIAFTSDAKNLIPGSELTRFGYPNYVYIHDTQNATTTPVLVPLSDRDDPDVNRDGYVAAASVSLSDDAEILAIDTFSHLYHTESEPYRISDRGIYVHHRATNTNRWIDVGYEPSISADGSQVAFQADEDHSIYGADLLTAGVGATGIDPLCPQSNGCIPFGVNDVWDGDISGPVVTDIQTLTDSFYANSICEDTDDDGWGWQHPQGTPGRSCSTGIDNQLVNNLGQCDYTNADRYNGWGWNAVTATSCPPLPVNSQDNCDYSNAGNQNGWGWDPVLLQSCAPVTSACEDRGDYPWGWNPVTLRSCRECSE